MVSTTEQSTNLSGGDDLDRSLATFLKDLSTSLRDLNKSVLSMTEFLVDATGGEEFRAALKLSESAVRRSVVAIAFADWRARQHAARPSDTPVAAEPLPANPSPASPLPSNASPATVAALPSDDKWYAVTIGRDPGVFFTSREVQPNTSHIPHGKSIKCDTEAKAKETFDQWLRAGLVKKVTYETKILTWEDVYGTQS